MTFFSLLGVRLYFKTKFILTIVSLYTERQTLTDTLKSFHCLFSKCLLTENNLTVF